jgi:hypothetical protein
MRTRRSDLPRHATARCLSASPRYRRLFKCDADEWFGSYGPDHKPIDPEELGSWRLSYRIERG